MDCPFPQGLSGWQQDSLMYQPLFLSFFSLTNFLRVCSTPSIRSLNKLLNRTEPDIYLWGTLLVAASNWTLCHWSLSHSSSFLSTSLTHISSSSLWGSCGRQVFQEYTTNGRLYQKKINKKIVTISLLLPCCIKKKKWWLQQSINYKIKPNGNFTFPLLELPL